MLIKAASIADGDTLDSEICIVGAGAAGITLARELAHGGVPSLLLEAGDMGGHAGTQRLYRGRTDDPEHHLEPDRDRTRGVGGTSAMWGGRCIPFDPIDFEARLGHGGWPFGRATLDPFYRRAQPLVDCGPFAYDAGEAGLEGALLEGFDDDALTTTSLERWSPPTHFGKTFGPELVRDETVTLITRAVVVGIETDADDGRVERLRVRGPRGRRFSVRARRVVLAGGGLETARLLLATGRERPHALGDHAGWLGRGYMTHLNGVVARLLLEPGVGVLFGYERDPDGVYVRRRFRLADAVQRDQDLPNLYGVLDRPLLDDASHRSAVLSLTYLAKRVLQRQSRDTAPGGRLGLYYRHLRNLVLGAPEVLTVLPKFGRERFLSGRRLPSLLLGGADGAFHLYFHAEQRPERASRVVLEDTADAFGLPRLHVRFRVSDADVEGVYRAHLAIDEALRRWGRGRLEFLGADPRADIRASKATLGHHLGTTRMAAAPADGVVDPDCRVHGVDNLFVASAAVFPTSSQAHPMLTTLALALRLADHLRGLAERDRERAA
jgi:choline dehydrogenase-like flavoprotein